MSMTILGPPTEQKGTDLPRGPSHFPKMFYISSEAPTSAMCRVEKIPEDWSTDHPSHTGHFSTQGMARVLFHSRPPLLLKKF